LAVQVPMGVRMVAVSRRPGVLLHVVVMFLRAFARTAGFVRGWVAALVASVASRRAASAGPK
jgi:hypothetical protein